MREMSIERFNWEFYENRKMIKEMEKVRDFLQEEFKKFLIEATKELELRRSCNLVIRFDNHNEPTVYYREYDDDILGFSLDDTGTVTVSMLKSYHDVTYELMKKIMNFIEKHNLLQREEPILEYKKTLTTTNTEEVD